MADFNFSTAPPIEGNNNEEAKQLVNKSEAKTLVQMQKQSNKNNKKERSSYIEVRKRPWGKFAAENKSVRGLGTLELNPSCLSLFSWVHSLCLRSSVVSNFSFHFN
ncbi:hypothetical protein SESBI_26811 [Sesbania bispinosa]|nr:hypothetical protein SESBI_26811 [Sesbania bispinosa]